MSKKFLFILGSGASVDSGLPTYRGPNSLHTTDPETYFEGIDIREDVMKVWSYFEGLLKASIQATPGPTYELIKELLNEYPGSCVITQNIDGLLSSMLGQEDQSLVIELHGNNRNMICLNPSCGKIQPLKLSDPKCKSCTDKCGYAPWCRPDIVCYGESLDPQIIQRANILSKQQYSHVLVIGTTLQFSYLNRLINNAKQRGAQVMHINPDDDYHTNVKQNELWMKTTAYQGLLQFKRVLLE